MPGERAGSRDGADGTGPGTVALTYLTQVSPALKPFLTLQMVNKPKPGQEAAMSGPTKAEESGAQQRASEQARCALGWRGRGGVARANRIQGESQSLGGAAGPARLVKEALI